MQVETYEVEEIKSSDAATMAADSAAIELSKSLGLEGQLRLSDPQTDTRCPYQKMTALQKVVFESVFPKRTSVTDYDSGPIPLRVLQVLAHSKELPMFKRFEVWHPLDAKQPDPLLVAHTSDYDYSDNTIFVLARWGDSLVPFEKLVEKAKAIWIASRKVKANKLLAEIKDKISEIEDEAEVAFTTGRTETHSFYL